MSTASAGKCDAAQTRGAIDSVHNGIVSGWAFNTHGQPVHVRILANGQPVGEAVANEYRQSLEKAGVGDGAHGFSLLLEFPFTVGSVLQLEIIDIVSGLRIAADPVTIGCYDPAFLSEEEMAGRGLSAQVQPRRPNRPIRRRLYKAVKKYVNPVKGVIARQTSTVSKVSPPPGTLARIALLEDTSINSRANAALWPRLRLPETTNPVVSIVIPVHNEFHRTYQCLVSLILAGSETPYEVLVVDDCSTDVTCEIEDRVDNLRVMRNESNLGFLGSCMHGASEAHGDYLLFLNNDTEVVRGWLDEMHDVFSRFDSVGAVGAKLVYPDGRLQDAGGIVWNSGVPWNAGHGHDPEDPEFNYVREVDYLTGAALMVGCAAWDAVGGFTKEYAPAYYEDTDLAFKLREAGWRTMYCPQAEVIHYEGCSNGTSLDSGVKKYQVVNTTRFRETWAEKFVDLGDEGNDIYRNKDRNRGLRVLVIDHEYPRIGRDAGSYAALQEMRLMLDLGCKLTFLPANLAWAGKHVETLQRLGIECVYSPWVRSIDEFLKRRGAEFDAVYVTRYTVAEKILPSVRRTSSAKILFNNADLHFLREMRAAIQQEQGDLTQPIRTRQRELAVMKDVDVVLSYSDVERQIIASHLMRSDHVFRCPWVLESAPSKVPFKERHHIAFMGGFGHPPNKEAIDWFILHVIPLLRERRPDVEFHIHYSRVLASRARCWTVLLEESQLYCRT